MKNGQVTLFIIAGILLLLIIGGYFTFTYIKQSRLSEEQDRLNTLNEAADNVRSSVEACLKQTAFNGIKALSRQGGYMDIPPPLSFQDTSLWYVNQVNVQPTLNEIKFRLENYVGQNIADCANLHAISVFKIQEEIPHTIVTFTSESVRAKLNYRIVLTNGNYIKTFETFDANLQIRFRRMYELASQLINKQLDPKFKFSAPLEGISSSFDVQFTTFNNNQVYTITDPDSFENSQHLTLAFASQFGNSDLKRTVTLQNNSNIMPVEFPFIVYSLDRMANLIIMPGTTFSLNNTPVSNITVQQLYPENVTRYDVPMHELEDDSVTYGNITWNVTYPIYEFEPTGMRFNNPQRLVLYWDQDRNPRLGNMGILYDEGAGWRPLQSKANYDENYVYTDIPGFSKYTPMDCGKQSDKEVSAKAKIDPGGKCITKLVVTIVVIIVLIAVIIVLAIFCQVCAGALVVIGIEVAELGVAIASVTLFVGGVSILVGGAIVGGAYINSEQTFGVDTDSITFTPTCDQTVHIFKDSSKAVGKCTPANGIYEVKAGEPVTIQPVIKKCTGARKYFCGSCSLKCSTKFK